MNNTGKNWSGYRGETLTAFAKSGPKFDTGKEIQDFASHLEKYGTADDFAAWAATDPSFWLRYSAMGLLAQCPTVSSPVLIHTLENSLDRDLHGTVAHEMLRLAPVQEHRPVVQNVLNHVNYSLCSSSVLHSLVHNLMRGRFFDVMEKKWSVFEPTLKQDLQQNILDAARLGWDLRSKIEGTPSNHSKYFEDCCEGNLLHRVQELAGKPIKTASITRGFYKAAQNHHESVVRHLWDTYPNTPWHGDQEATSVLTAAIDVSWEMGQKILEHHQRHYPELIFTMRGTLMQQAIRRNNPQLFAFLEPHTNKTEWFSLYKEAVVCEFEKAVVMLLRRPDSHPSFHSALNEFRNDYRNWTTQIQWAENIYSHHQKGVLSAEITNLSSLSSRAARKI